MSLSLIASLDSDPLTSLDRGSNPSSARIAAGVIPGAGSYRIPPTTIARS
jgi:hypothetical protein